jgi:hypothetical protein
MNGRTVRGRLGNLTEKRTGAQRTEAARRAGALASGSVRRAVTGVQLTAPERQRINESLPRPTDRVRGDGGATRTPPATKQPVYNAQGRPIGAIRFDPRTGESVFIPPRNAR